MSKIKVDEIWQLQLTRNADFMNALPTSHAESVAKVCPSQEEGKTAHFCVFDYYDKLVCRKEISLTHRDCLCLDSNSRNDLALTIASHALTLVSLKEEKPQGDADAGVDPFFYSGSSVELPFLSLILVTITAKEARNSGELPRVTEEEVGQFLLESAAKLCEIVKKTYEDYLDKENLNKNDDTSPVYRVLYSINSGNFCIVVRSRYPELSFCLATKVRASVLNEGKAHGYPSVQCSTFTITCMEYLSDRASLLSDELAEKLRCKVVMRLALRNNEFYQQLCKLEDGERSRSDAYGLFGRYDVSLTLTMSQFNALYPYICERRFHVRLAGTGEESVSDQTLELLRKTLTESDIRCVNERILINEFSSSELANQKDCRNRKTKLEDENAVIAERFLLLKKMGTELPFCQDEFRRCLLLLQDLWESYCSLRNQDDSVINGNVFLSQIWFLLDEIKNYIDSIANNLRFNLLEDIKSCIDDTVRMHLLEMIEPCYGNYHGAIDESMLYKTVVDSVDDAISEILLKPIKEFVDNIDGRIDKKSLPYTIKAGLLAQIEHFVESLDSNEAKNQLLKKISNRLIKLNPSDNENENESKSSLIEQIGAHLEGIDVVVARKELLEQIEQCINDFDGSTVVEFYDDLTASTRRAIDSISRFQKLMQSINQQSLQSPNYDVQLHTDLEKYVIAYTEFSRRFLAEHFQEDGHSSENDKQEILPLVTVDTRNEMLAAQPLFLLPYRLHKECAFSNRSPERVLLPIELPDIDTLGSIYTTLPLISHELSHNFRVINRDERNDALIRYIFHNVAAYTVRSWISYTCERTPYLPFGAIQDKLTDCMAGCLERFYRQYYGNAHKEANIGVILTNSLLFLDRFMFIDPKNFVRKASMLTTKKKMDCLKQLAWIYQETNDLQRADWFDLYNSCRERLSIITELSNNKSDPARCRLTEQDAHNLERLGRKMLYSIADDRTFLLWQAAAEFFGFADRYFKSAEAVAHTEDQKEAIREEIKILKRKIGKLRTNLSTLCDDQKLIKEYLSTDYAVDEWIAKMIRKIIDLCESLSFAPVSTSDELLPELERLELSRKNLVYSAQDCCRTLKDTCHFFLLLVDDWGEWFNEHERKALLEALHTTMRAQLQRIQRKGGAEKILYGAEQIQGMLAPLGIDLQDSTLFIETLQSVLTGLIPIDRIEMLVQDSAILYREVFADLGMCAALGLEPFGYLLVLARSKSFRDFLIYNSNPSSQNLERLSTVCWALNWDKKQLLKLKTNCCKFHSNMKACLVSKIKPSGKKTEAYKCYFGRMKSALDNTESAEHIQKMPDIRELANYLKPDEDFYDFQQDMEYLWYAVQFCCHMMTCKIFTINKELRLHFSTLFNEKLRPRWKESESTSSDFAMLRKIGYAYNNGIVSFAGTEVTKDLLSFVLYYYYHAWNVYSGE